MDLGMPTLIETRNLEECAALCRELKLQFIELNMNLPQYQLNKIDVAEFKKIADEYDIYYTIHLDENLNPADFNPYITEAYTKTVVKTIELAKQLNIPVLNMHLSRGVHFTLPDKKIFLFEKYKEKYLQGITDFRNICENAISNSNIKICIENCDGYTDFQIEAIDLLLQSHAFALTFDIGHNHGINGTDEQIITSRANRLLHFHIHDAIGRKNHLALGEGEIDLQKYLKFAEAHRCRAVLETKTILGLKKSVKYMRNKNYI